MIVYHGDGASSQGDVNEAYVFAASYNAPVVFFCQNNQWAISEPIALQSRIPLYERARGFGFPGVQVDGKRVTFEIVAIGRIAIGRPALQQGFEIAAHGRVGVFGDRHTATGVANENVGNSGVDRGSPDDASNFAGDLDGPAAASGEGQAVLFAHGRRACEYEMR